MNPNNRFIPYGRQNIDDDDIESVLNTLKSPFITQGPKIIEFEEAICQRVDSKYAIAVNSATSALHLSCLALGLNTNETLWTSPISFVASANCARYCGAKVDFIDINPSTGLIDINQLYKKLKKAEKFNKLPKVLVPVHLSGTSCNMKEIFKMSKEFNFSIIEDASHALGAKYEDSNVGSCKYSDLTVFSFHPVKIITTGEGGAATTNNIKLINKMRDLRSHGIVKDKNRFQGSKNYPWLYEQQSLGFNYRISDIQCSLGVSQIKKLDQITSERNNLLDNYRLLLKDLPLKLLEVPSGCYSSVHLAIVRLDSKDKNLHLNVFNFLRSKGIGVQVHYSPIHLQPYYKKLNFKKGDFPEAELYGHNAFSIPLYPGLNLDDQKYIIRLLKEAIDLGI